MAKSLSVSELTHMDATFPPFSVSMQTDSALFDSSITSRRALSCSAYCSASETIRSISLSLRPDDEAMVMDWSLFVALSLADTLTIPSTQDMRKTSEGAE